MLLQLIYTQNCHTFQNPLTGISHTHPPPSFTERTQFFGVLMDEVTETLEGPALQ